MRRARSCQTLRVKLLNTDQGLSLEQHTGDSGSYTFSRSASGHYTITVSAPGFAATTQQNLTVTVGLDLKVNVALKTGSTSETVTVSTAPPQLQAELSLRSDRRLTSAPSTTCR